MKTIKQQFAKNAIVTAMMASTLVLSGCKIEYKSDEGDGQEVSDALGSIVIDGTTVGEGEVQACGETTSGFEFPCDAIFVAPDAIDGQDITNDLLTALFEVPAGSTVVLPKGEFIVSETITIASAAGITLTGHGIHETKLDFSNSTGDDSIRFEGGTDLTIRDFGVYESNKNAIKVTNANGVHFAYTAVVWEGELEADNGAYGLYPLQCQNVLMENNFAAGSADAGIYVGQTRDVIVRDNVAIKNVAGIEIENTVNADVYNNMATGNTAGILVFDLPGLTNAYGSNIRVFNNEAYANNAENVGAGAVGIAPPGTGILVFATSNVEIYNNNITDNETSAIEIASYLMDDDDLANYPVNYGQAMTNGWTPLVRNVHAHDNFIARNGENPRGILLEEIIAGYTAPVEFGGKGERFPTVIYDGVGELLANAGQLVDFQAFIAGSQAEADGMSYLPYGPEDQICVSGNINGNTIDTYHDVTYGSVFGTDPNDPNNWIFDENFNPVAPQPTLLSEPMESGGLFACANERLVPTTVTIGGIDYGCEGDDLSEAACAL